MSALRLLARRLSLFARIGCLALAGCVTLPSLPRPEAAAPGAAPPAATSAGGVPIFVVRQGESQRVAVGPPPLKKPYAPEKLPPPLAEAPAGGLTLDQVINRTLLADRKLRAGFEAINQAHAEALTASLRPNPELFTDGQLLPLTRPFTVDRQGGPPQQDVQLSWKIDWFVFGKRAAAMAAAARGVEVSEADFADLVRVRARDVSLAFYDVLEAEALVELARQDVANLRRVEEATDKAVKADARARVDLSRVRLDLLRSRQALREAESAVAQTRSKLRAFLGPAEPGAALAIRGSLELPDPGELPELEASFQQAREMRPDIQSLVAKVSQALAALESEERKGKPEITPQVGYTRQYQRKAIGFPDADSWSVAVTATLPVFDRNQGNRAKAASVVTQSRLEHEQGLVELRAELEQAIQDLRLARSNARAVAGEQQALAREVQESLTKAYAAGTRTLLDVLDAQRSYRETVRLLITSRANLARAVIRYNAAVGLQLLK